MDRFVNGSYKIEAGFAIFLTHFFVYNVDTAASSNSQGASVISSVAPAQKSVAGGFKLLLASFFFLYCSFLYDNILGAVAAAAAAAAKNGHDRAGAIIGENINLYVIP